MPNKKNRPDSFPKRPYPCPWGWPSHYAKNFLQLDKIKTTYPKQNYSLSTIYFKFFYF